MEQEWGKKIKSRKKDRKSKEKDRKTKVRNNNWNGIRKHMQIKQEVRGKGKGQER